jgi:hypothetical protein
MSLDGLITGPEPGPDPPLRAGGERLHEWAYGLATFRERHGESGGVTNADDQVLAEAFDRAGAVCSAAALARGETIPGRAGGGTTRRSICRCSC